MYELQVFNGLKVKEVNGSVMFDAETAAIGLGISRIAKSGNEVVRWERVNKYLAVPTSGHDIKRGDFITEPQFYKLAIKANNETAEKFQDWVTLEVLPSIRKHGAYMDSETIEKVLTDPDTIIKIATDLKREKEARVKAEGKVIEMQPKAEYYDKVLETTNSVVVTQIAKDYGYSARKFNELLQSMGVQYRVGGQWVLKAQYQDKGYTETKTVHTMNYGRTFSTIQTRWTQKGRHFLYELLESNDILPLHTQVQ